MSFGWSATDIANLVKLAWKTVQNSKKAVGEFDELTRQTQSFHSVIRKLRNEKANPESLLNRTTESHWEDLRPSLDGSRDVLESLNAILVKYASINRKDKGLGRLWTRVKFGNKELDALNDLRQKVRFYSGTISAVLNTITVGSLGRIEKSLDEAGLKDIKPALDNIAKKLVASNHKEGSVLTAYANDDTAVWKSLRRELIRENIVPSDIISKNKSLITKFIRELGDRGMLDDDNEDHRDHEETSEDAAVSDQDVKNEPHFRKGGTAGQHHSSTASQSNEVSQYHPSSSPPHSDSSMYESGPDRAKEEWDDFHTPDDGRIASLLDRADTSSIFDMDDSSDIFSHHYGSKYTVPIDQHHLSSEDLMFDGPSELTIEAVLKTDLQDRKPELVTKLSLFRSHPSESAAFNKMETPFWNHWGRKVNTYVVFLATPWGLCLLASTVNLSLCLQNLQHFGSLLCECLQSLNSDCFRRIDLVPSLPACGALKNGQQRYDKKEMIAKLEGCRHAIASNMGRTSYLSKSQAPKVSSSNDQDFKYEVAEFCDTLQQRMYDQWKASLNWDGKIRGSSPHCRGPPADWEVCILELEYGVKEWMRQLLDECGDIIRFILFRTTERPLYSETHLWIGQQKNLFKAATPGLNLEDSVKENHEEAACNVDYDAELEIILARFEDFIPKSVAFLTSNETNPQTRRKAYVEVSEGLFNNVLLKLDQLPAYNGEDFRTRKKGAIRSAQELLDQLKEAYESNQPSNKSKEAKRPPLHSIKDPEKRLEAILERFEDFSPKCTAFLESTENDPRTRRFQYQTLNEAILTGVLIELDNLELAGNERLKMSRKAAVQQVQKKLDELNEAYKTGSGYW